MQCYENKKVLLAIFYLGEKLKGGGLDKQGCKIVMQYEVVLTTLGVKIFISALANSAPTSRNEVSSRYDSKRRNKDVVSRNRNSVGDKKNRYRQQNIVLDNQLVELIILDDLDHQG
ncbi:hypothetical protein IEQ34_021990 [Dendrobium chrysotoxum]|uniref:Uncharacterized protein n=1 Tax=Dendrobium chrysotoxum TaxID=161865 RepID=A0AAV7FXT8_DENCH|nr:hypothetical protein IEQ34_021990 [Dendrobium chrysotoxum]